MLERLEKHLKVAAATGAVVAAYLFGVAYFASSSYYGVFGITAADAGITRSTAVVVAATGFGWMAVLALIAAVTAWASVLIGHSKRGPRSFRSVYALALLPAMGLGVWATRFGWVIGLVLIVLAFGASFATAFHGRELVQPRVPSTHRAWLLPYSALVLAIGALGFFLEVDSAALRLAGKVMDRGSFETATTWENFTRFALGIRVVPVESDDVTCAVALAHQGDRTWVMQSPGESVAIRSVQRSTLVVRYDTRPRRSDRPRTRPCWRDD